MGGFVGAIVAILFIRKWFLRKRERKFVKRIVDQDNSAIAAAPLHERSQLQQLHPDRLRLVFLFTEPNIAKGNSPAMAITPEGLDIIVDNPAR